MIKKTLSALLVLAVLLCVPLTAHAQNVPENRNDCSIEVLVRYDGKNINGGTLTAVKVGYVDEENGDYFFSRELDHIRLDHIQSADAVSELRKFYESNKSDYDFYKRTVNINNGKATFNNLPTGLYLIFQEKAANGYSKLGAFLVSVPYMEDGEYQYQVTAAIKSELEREPEPKPADPPPKPKDPELPQTGQLNWPVPMLAVLGLALFAAGWVLRFGRKADGYEK